MGYFLLMLGWIIYFSLHSILADFGVKRSFYAISPSVRNWYRLIYNVLALIGFIALLIISVNKTEMMWVFDQWHWIPALLIGLPGVVIMFLSAKAFDLPEFLGLRRSDSMDRGASEEGLIQTGLYAYVRHPLYSGTLLVVISVLILNPSISFFIFLIAMIIYLPIGMHFEEKKLVQEFGEEYRAYQNRVNRLIPGVY